MCELFPESEIIITTEATTEGNKKISTTDSVKADSTTACKSTSVIIDKSDTNSNIQTNTNTNRLKEISTDEKTETNVNTNDKSTHKNYYPESISNSETNNIINGETHMNIERSTINNQNVNPNSNIVKITENINMINNHKTDYNIHRTNIIIYTTYEQLYDNSNLFQGLDNTEKHDQIQDYLSNNYSLSENPNIIFKGESDFIYQITTTEKEKELMTKNFSKTDYNISILDFSECEQLLKEKYNINPNVSLIILKFEKMTNKTSEKNIQYEIYEPFNMTLLNMSICENTEVKMYIPFVLTGETLELYEEMKEMGYNIFDKNDKFYNDICTPFTSETGTDVPLSARQKYIYNQYASLCQAGCELEDYNFETQLVSCNCKFNSEEIEPEKEEKFNPQILYKSFYDIL